MSCGRVGSVGCGRGRGEREQVVCFCCSLLLLDACLFAWSMDQPLFSRCLALKECCRSVDAVVFSRFSV